MSIKDKVAIVGAGCSKFGERWDCGFSDLVIESSSEALNDAGIGLEDIQACFVGYRYCKSNLSRSSLKISKHVLLGNLYNL
ncbi:MAG: hypothetical protein ACOX0E_09020 [Syntrophomonadaceae bacterium]